MSLREDIRDQITAHGIAWAVPFALGTLVWSIRRAYTNALVAKHQGSEIQEMKQDIRDLRNGFSALHLHLVGKELPKTHAHSEKDTSDDE